MTVIRAIGSTYKHKTRTTLWHWNSTNVTMFRFHFRSWLKTLDSTALFRYVSRCELVKLGCVGRRAACHHARLGGGVLHGCDRWPQGALRRHTASSKLSYTLISFGVDALFNRQNVTRLKRRYLVLSRSL